METYFDSSPATGMTPEVQQGGEPLSDIELRRTNPKRYDPRQDWYTYPNEHMHDSEITNRTDETRLSWKHEVTSSLEALHEIDWQLQAYSSRPAVSFDTFLRQVQPFQRWWYDGGDLVLLTGANARVSTVNNAMYKTAQTRVALIEDAMWTEFYEHGSPKNAVAEVWDTKEASLVLIQLPDQQRVAHLSAVRAHIIQQMTPLERLAMTVQDPVAVQVFQAVSEHGKNAAVSIPQLRELAGIPATVKDNQILDALQTLAKHGAVYPVEGNLWTVTAEASKVRPFMSYNKHIGVPFKRFAADIFPRYWEAFKLQHPELNPVYTKLERSAHNFQGFISDVWSIFNHEAPEAPLEKGKPVAMYGEVPDYLVSVEHAIAEELRFINHPKMPLFGGSVPSLVPKAKAYTIGQRLSKHPELIPEVQRALARTIPGTVLTPAERQRILKNALTVLHGETPPEAAVTSLASSFSWSNLTENAIHVIDTKDNQVERKRKAQAYVDANPAKAGLYLTNAFNGLGADGASGLDFTTNMNYSNCMLAGVLFEGKTVRGCNFTNANLSSSNWTDARVEDCIFQEASLRGAVFLPARCSENNFGGTDLEDATVKKNLLNGNTGNPKNLTIAEAEGTPGDIRELKNHPVVHSQNLAIDEAEIPGAKRIVEALRGILSNRTLAKLRFFKEAVLDQSQVDALRTFLADPSKPPVLDTGGLSPFDWLQEANKSGDLQQAGFSKKDVGTMFGKMRNLTEGPKKVEKPTDPYAEKISAFISQYKSATEVPASALLGLLDDQDSELSRFIQDISARTSTIPQSRLYEIYYALKDVVQGKQFMPGLKVTKHINLFPHTSFVDNLSEGHHTPSGGGTQFAIVITPDYSKIPRDVAVASRYVIPMSGTHLYGEAQSFSRIYPLEYTTVKNNQTDVRKVWMVSELQSDSYQKGNDNDSKIQRATGIQDATKKFRHYFRHWPETLLHTIIQHAQQAGVSEVWVPGGAEVIKKTAPSRLKDDSWDYAYDRPAKAFGGVLKNVGVSQQLDPGSGYERKSSMYYVIQVPQKVQ